MKLFYLVSILFLSGCSVGGDFIKPVTADKAVYFHIEKGSISGYGVQITGENITHQSSLCPKDAGCAIEKLADMQVAE